MKACSACSFYVPINASQGRCHRFPKMSKGNVFEFPPHAAGDWCGEFSAKPDPETGPVKTKRK